MNNTIPKPKIYNDKNMSMKAILEQISLLNRMGCGMRGEVNTTIFLVSFHSLQGPPVEFYVRCKIIDKMCCQVWYEVNILCSARKVYTVLTLGASQRMYRWMYDSQ